MDEGISLRDRYGHLFKQITGLSHSAAVVDETNVYQEANPATRRIVNEMVGDNLLPDSRLEGREHFADCYRAIKDGKRALVLSEHYSNLDFPTLCYLFDHDGSDWGTAFAKNIVAIAGMKLNEENPLVRAWTEAFTRIVIYPSRSLAKVMNADEEARGRKINMAAMRALDTAKKRGQPVLVFPSGTRYRPGKPETKRGVREIDSYLRTFDVMILVSLNGSCLRISETAPEDMLSDRIVRDTVIAAASPVIECKPFRNAVIESLGDTTSSGIDPKQAVADRIMELLEKQHQEYEQRRAPGFQTR